VNTALLGILLAAAAVIAWIVAGPLLRARRRARQRRRSLSEADRMYLRRRVPLYAAMPDALRQRLDGLVNVFLAEKEFVGCGGLTVTRPMQLAIAAQACLLVLGRDEHVYDMLRSVLVYPSQFVVREAWHDEDGVVTEEERVLAGQAWDVSRILLSWEDVTTRGTGSDAYNVVLHEFAHYLDHEGGGMDGAPLLGGAEDQARWAATFQAEFDALRAAVDRGEETLLDPYAAEDEAEFFAVATEAFFEGPRELSRHHPDLYVRLRDYYRLDPAAWT
jgi:Mlc titration factor MtfA (ptsG expression regulator)